MKFLLLLVLVFTVNCRSDFPDGPEYQASLIGPFLSTDSRKGFEHHDYSDVDKQDGNDQNEIKRKGNKGKKTLQKLFNIVQELGRELNSIKMHQYNITNTNTELKTELQSLRNHQNYTAGANKELITNLQSTIENNTDVGLNLLNGLRSKLQSVETAISNQDSKLDIISAAVTNLTSTTAHPVTTCQPQPTSTTTTPVVTTTSSTTTTPVTTTSSTTTTPVTTTSSTTTTSATTTSTACPTDQSGYFIFEPTGQCFRFLTSGGSWPSANSRCQREGLVMAKVDREPIKLVAYLMATYNLRSWTWVGGQGDGVDMKWVQDGETISKSSPFWVRSPGSVGTAYALALMTGTFDYIIENPNKPYLSAYNGNGQHTLCELVMT